ncbi:MAG TPA: ATP-binding protein [Anaeromyxobacteraceae bacterium]|nr:ATP-binding protein [Anaeromyxobacteraceae bacterium]
MTLRGKIVALVLGLTLAILAGLWITLSRSWGGWSVEAVDRELVGRAAAIAHNVEYERGALEVENDEDDGAVMRDPAHPYRIVGPGGAVLAATAELAWPAADLAAPEARFVELEDAAGRHWRVVTRAFPIEDEHARDGKHGGRDRKRGRDAGDELGTDRDGPQGPARITVQVAGEAAPFGALEERFRRGLLVALAVALAAGGLGAALLAHVSLAPMRRLASEVDAIGAASLDRRVGTERLDPELRRVATAFNGLLGRLEDAMGRQRQLVSRASHALRTPVATILTRAEVALRRERDPSAYRQALQDVAEAARESAALVAHLLTLSRLDEQRGSLPREDVQLRRVADEIVRMLQPRADEAGIALEADVQDGVAARVNAAALRELLEALLDNAIHYTPRGGRAGVGARAEGSGVALAVWDTGPGIPAEERARVLERFYRGDAAQASGRPGSGLGLAIVKAIADAHGASVSLGDRAGGGLEVTLRFPGA